MVYRGSDGDETSGGPGDVLGMPARLRPDWHAEALCRDYPHLSWFPEYSAQISPALKVCAECPVSKDCRSWALSQDPWALAGIWGGLTQRERIFEAKKAGRVTRFARGPR